MHRKEQTTTVSPHSERLTIALYNRLQPQLPQPIVQITIEIKTTAFLTIVGGLKKS